MSGWKLPKILSALAVLLLLGFAGCSRPQTAVEAGNATQTFHTASVGEPSELDPHVINAPPDFKIVPMLFESVVSAAPATLQAMPGVASSWEISDDRRTYTFHLRPEARWSNGDPLTASDFLYSWERALSPALGSQYTFLFDAVVGAKEFAAGVLKDFAQVGFAAPDAHTVTITLKQPTPYFLEIVANNPVWSPVHPATIEAAGGMTARGSGWTRAENFVGNGAFTLAEWKPADIIRIEKSPTYWNADSVRLNAVVYHVYESSDTEERAFRAGQIHRTERVPIPKVPAYRAQSPTPLRETDSLVSRFVNVNTTRAPFDDARVRRAFALAIDRDAIAARIYLGTAAPARRVVPLGTPGYSRDEDFEDNATAARALLAEAGYPGGRGFPVVPMSVETGSRTQLPEALQARWLDVLGVRVEILLSESRVHWSNLQLGDYTLSIGGWVSDYPDATAMLDIWGGSSGWNFTGWKDPAYDETLAAAARAFDPAVRSRVLRRAEGQLVAAMPVIPICFEKRPLLVSPSVIGLEENAMDRVDYRPVVLQP